MDIYQEIKASVEQNVNSEGPNKLFLITGSAGSGKTYQLKKLRADFKKSSIVAMTGIAALNCDGITIHSWLKLKTNLTQKKLSKGKNITGDYKKTFENLDLLIIDEISFVSATLLDAVSESLKKIRKNNNPFGGVTVVASGDLLQLPPVVPNDEKKEIKKLGYKSSYFFDSKAFIQMETDQNVSFIRLAGNFRQQDDKKYLHLLNKIRNRKEHSFVVEQFNKYCHNDKLKNPLILSPHKKTVEALNTERLNEIQKPTKTYHPAKQSGWFRDRHDEQLPAMRELKLKEGAKVIMIRNDYKGRRWVNGSVGIIEELNNDNLKIKINNKTCEVEREKWEYYKSEYDESIEEFRKVEEGVFEQFPVKLGWAYTIHKSQGLTLDDCRIDLGGMNPFGHGMMYVALSRCKSLKSLSLAQPLKEEHIWFDETIIKFEEKLNSLSKVMGDQPEEIDSSLEEKITEPVPSPSELTDRDYINAINEELSIIKRELFGAIDKLSSLEKRVKAIENSDSNDNNFEDEENAEEIELKDTDDELTDDELFDLLRNKRNEIAIERNLPAYCILKDVSLHELAAVRPEKLEDLQDIFGFGPTKIEQYGLIFIDIILANR